VPHEEESQWQVCVEGSHTGVAPPQVPRHSSCAVHWPLTHASPAAQQTPLHITVEHVDWQVPLTQVRFVPQEVELHSQVLVVPLHAGVVPVQVKLHASGVAQAPAWHTSPDWQHFPLQVTPVQAPVQAPP
jgi:hypothetical protein